MRGLIVFFISIVTTQAAMGWPSTCSYRLKSFDEETDVSGIVKVDGVSWTCENISKQNHKRVRCKDTLFTVEVFKEKKIFKVYNQSMGVFCSNHLSGL